MADFTALQLVNSLPAAPVRSDDAHKGDCGRALLIAGSRGMSGAACLSSTAALRGGAGLVTVAVPESILSIVAGYEPSYMTIGLPEDAEGRLSNAAPQKLSEVLSRQNAVAVGPGLSQSAGLLDVVTHLYTTLTQPAVFDADSLNILAKRPYVLPRTSEAAARILTPHPGEFSRLTGLDIETIQQNRQQHAAEFAKRNGLIVVLKGQNTVITDGTRVAINATGNSAMATGGTGDVLTGVLVALLAQGMAPFEAAQFGVHLHGLAGDIAAEENSKIGLIASDLLRYIPRAWRDLGR
ncbi:NAD(P)H-hydrate dehydratase [Schlesneria sp. DSM 10557]|uniref:NAD(P)H-hydrate dehydratase n=1 Tax=Schlesneria sp. DSM 10557 TaxID=3044399 RepID=UPI0035A0EE3D